MISPETSINGKPISREYNELNLKKFKVVKRRPGIGKKWFSHLKKYTYIMYIYMCI